MNRGQVITTPRSRVTQDALVCSLPNEILLHIASFLSVSDLSCCSSVCERMGTICRDYSLWRRFFVEINTFSCPVGRLCHTGVVYNDRMYIFGGHITQPQSEYFHTVKQDMYEYTFATRKWAEMTAEGAPRRTEHSAIVHGDEMVVFGGYSGNGYENTAMAYNFISNTWSTLDTKGPQPTARSAHTAVVVGHKMYVYGGWNGVHCMNDMHELDLETKTWAPVTTRGDGPCSRCSHGAAVVEDGADTIMYIYGGYAIEKANDSPGKGYLSDLYAYNITTSEWMPAKMNKGSEIPCPRSRFRLVGHSGLLYLFAGWNSQAHFNHLYKYDPRAGSWSLVETNFDSQGIGQFSMVVHDDVMYVFSGFTPNVGTRSSLFAYPLISHSHQAR